MHYTPKEVGEVLSEFLPNPCGSILEPAVGAGDLLLPILAASDYSLQNIICLNTNAVAINQAKCKLPSNVRDRVTFINDDFLKWVQFDGANYQEAFDCIVMNPPFSGRAETAVNVPSVSYRTKVPIEWAFMQASMKLVRKGGRILAIVPASIACSPSYSDLRSIMMAQGAVRVVHELPHYTFAGVESKTYLLIWDKIKSRAHTLLMNHDLKNAETIKIPKVSLIAGERLDYSFHVSKKSLSDLRLVQTEMEWTPLGNIATLVRGQIPTPPQTVLHSTNGTKGIWVPPCRNHSPKYDSFPHAKAGDILVKRVSRNCLESFGVYNGPEVPLSDCVISIRPNRGGDRWGLVLALRAMLSSGHFTDNLIHGTGCSYINISELREFEVPIGITKRNRAMVKTYKTAINTNDKIELEKIEAKALRNIWGAKSPHKKMTAILSEYSIHPVLLQSLIPPLLLELSFISQIVAG